MSSHTPGPWKYYRSKLRSNFSTIVIEVQDANGQAIVAWGGFDHDNQKSKQRQANARLMALSPELLEALNWCVAEINRDTPAARNAIAVMKKLEANQEKGHAE